MEMASDDVSFNIHLVRKWTVSLLGESDWKHKIILSTIKCDLSNNFDIYNLQTTINFDCCVSTDSEKEKKKGWEFEKLK